MNRGDIGENYVAVHYDNDYTCRIFLYYYYSSRMNDCNCNSKSEEYGRNKTTKAKFNNNRDTDCLSL